MSKSYGYAGKILRVDLTNRTTRLQDSLDYKDYIGGMGFGYKIMWDEVPAGTKPYDAANKVIIAAGPLSGTGVPCSARTNITSLLPTNPFNLISDGHMGGHFSPAMKYAGYDAIVLEGKASSPVWLRIEDDVVKFEDASNVWGKGTFATTDILSEIMGEGSYIACIGQAGENMVNMSTIMTSKSHSAGGHGGILGSKNLKAIGIKGTKPVHIAADRKIWNETDEFMMTLIGANNQNVQPRVPQPWAEFHHPGSRWTATPGRMWGAANPPIDTGTCDAADMNSVGLRTHKGFQDLGDGGPAVTQRMGGCQSCPVRCHSYAKVPKLKDYGFNEVHGNTCMGYFSPSGVMIMGAGDPVLTRTLGASLADDYGAWCNYGQIGRDIRYAYESGILKKVLSEEEYNSLPWQEWQDKNPEALIDIYRRIAFREGEFGEAVGQGSAALAKRWGFGEAYYQDTNRGTYIDHEGNEKNVSPTNMCSPVMVFPKHHHNETANQVGALIGMMFNRDSQNHSHQNFNDSRLPVEIAKSIAKEVWGSEDAFDTIATGYTPINQGKINFTRWAIIRNILHDSLTLCNWMWPMTTSPRKDRNYRGDTSLESKFYSMATGFNMTEEELDLAGERIFTLHRAMTVKQMGTKDMRNEHDVQSDSYYDDEKAFTEGSNLMNREDFQKSLTMLYKTMGWDEVTGSPTKATLVRLGMADVAAELEKLNLL